RSSAERSTSPRKPTMRQTACRERSSAAGTSSADSTFSASGRWIEELQPNVPLGRLARSQRDEAGVHAVPLRAERVHVVVLLFDRAEAVVLRGPQVQRSNLG